MARVFPLEITAVNVAAMLAALDGKTPYTDDGWVTACVDFDTAPLAVVCIALPNRRYDAAANRDVAEAITLLPRFHTRVAKIMANDPDDIDLGSMEIDGDEIGLHYCFRYNAQPQFYFSKACHGGPVRPITLDPRWHSSTVVDLANAIYDQSAYDRMPILADALMDAGCDSDEIIQHCRGDGPHVHGCWVVGLLLDKE